MASLTHDLDDIKSPSMVSLPGNVLSVASIVSLTLLDACVAFWCSECREQSRRLKSTQLYAPNTLWQFSQITHSQAFYSRLQLIRWLVDRVTLPGFLPDMWTLEHTMVQPSAFDKKSRRDDYKMLLTNTGSIRFLGGSSRDQTDCLHGQRHWVVSVSYTHLTLPTNREV